MFIDRGRKEMTMLTLPIAMFVLSMNCVFLVGLPSWALGENPCVTDPPGEPPDNGDCVGIQWVYLGRERASHTFRLNKKDFPAAEWQFTLKDYKIRPRHYCPPRRHKVPDSGFEDFSCATPPDMALAAIVEAWDAKGNYIKTRALFLTKRNFGQLIQPLVFPSSPSRDDPITQPFHEKNTTNISSSISGSAESEGMVFQETGEEPTPSVASDSGMNPEIIIVQPGDTLSALAQKYGTTVQDLVDANGLTNPDHILVGQRLVVPPTQ